MWDAAADAAAVPGLGTAAVRALGRFMATMAALRDRAEEGVPVGDLLESLLDDTGYVDALEAERTIEAQGGSRTCRSSSRSRASSTRPPEDGEDTLDVFLQQIALVADADTRRDDEGLVTLMTLHNAKGLEYPIVFMIGCEEGVFPHSRSLDEGSLEEERRLPTSASPAPMRDLYLTYARRRAVFGAQRSALPSRFLARCRPTSSTARARSAAAAAPGSRGVRGTGLSWAARAAEARASFRLGDDVVARAPSARAW